MTFSLPALSGLFEELGFSLPDPFPVANAYVPAVRSGDLIFTSGQLPVIDGKLMGTGTLGDDITIEIAAQLAEICVVNALASLQTVIDIEDIVRVVKLTGYVASAPGFTQQPQVMDGASRLLTSALGGAGAHARSAVGVAALPLGAPVEVELVVQVRDA